MSVHTKTAEQAVVIVNGTSYNLARAIYVGVAGDIVATVKGTNITFKNAVAGSTLPVETTQVVASGTTATDLVALY